MTSLLLDWAIKGTLVVLLAGGAALALRRASAAARHLAWGLGVAGALAVPPVSLALPAWTIPGLSRILPPAAPAPAAPQAPGETPSVGIHDVAGADNETVGGKEPTEPAASGIDQAVGGGDTERVVAERSSEAVAASAGGPAADGERTNSQSASDPRARDEGSTSITAGAGTPWSGALAVMWALGACAVVAVSAGGVARRRRWARGARPSGDRRVTALVAQLARELGLRRRVRVLQGEVACMPMTWGAARPVILVPSDAPAWGHARLRAVLLHELAHVMRHDYLTQLVARAACAIYWFNPLVWLAARRLRVERELACDDLVLAAGSRASEYAGHLLAIARSLRPALPAAAAVALARPSHLASRLRAVLDPARARTTLSARGVIPAGVAAALVVLPVAGASPRPGAPVDGTGAAVEASMAAVDAPLARDTGAAPGPAAVGRDRPEPTPGPSPTAARLASLVPVLGRQCTWDRRGERTSSSTNVNDHHVRVRVTIDDCTLEVEMEGEIAFTDDDADVASISRGGYFEIEEREGRQTRKLRIEPSTGGLERRWQVDGDTRAYDADAQAWLARTLPALFRRTGINADARARRILERGGIDALLQEIELIPSDHVAGRYYRFLLAQGELDPATVGRLVREAGKRIDSDFELARLLIAVAEHQPLDAAVHAAYVEAAGSIDSDFEHRRVLSAILQREGLSREVAASMLRSATRITSDFELARLLIELVKAHPLDEALTPAFFEAVGGIDSDFERRRVLGTVLEQGAPRRDVLDQTLAAAQEIDSDFELARLLIQVAERYPIDGALPPSYLQAAGTIGSSHERTRVLTTFVARERLDPATLTSVLQAASGVSSDFERARLLIGAAERHALDDTSRPAFFRAAAGIDSDHELARVLTAALDRQPVAPATVAAALETASGLDSDFELSRVLVRMAQRGLVTEDLRPAFLRATETIQSEHERGKVLSALFPRARPAER